MRVVIIGSGYVGLVTGTCLAQQGHHVVCVDKDVARINGLRLGVVPFFEPDLPLLIQENVRQGRLHFACDMPRLDADTDVVFIAVGTPRGKTGGDAELAHVFAAAREIAENADHGLIVAIKSTVPVGAGDAVEEMMRVRRPEFTFTVVSNPEFLREGSAVNDCLKPERVVIGSGDPAGRAKMRELYAAAAKADATILCTERRTSELIKYASNAFLATKISFINEMADLCENVGADVDCVAKGMGLDSRIGASFLRAGSGYGGSCFPKDSDALLATAQGVGSRLRIVEAAVGVNRDRHKAMAQRVIEAVGGDVQGKTIGVLGLSFKPETDDIRDSPAILLIDQLLAAGARIRAYDPQACNQAKALPLNAYFAADAYDCAENVDGLVLATEWREFQDLDLNKLAKLVRTPVLVDLRNALDSQAVIQAGFVLHAIGKGEARRPAPRRSPNDGGFNGAAPHRRLYDEGGLTLRDGSAAQLI